MLYYVPKPEEDISDLVRTHMQKLCGNKPVASWVKYSKLWGWKLLKWTMKHTHQGLQIMVFSQYVWGFRVWTETGGPIWNYRSSLYYKLIFVSFQADLDAGLWKFYDSVADFICSAYNNSKKKLDIHIFIFTCYKLYITAYLDFIMCTMNCVLFLCFF